MAEQLAAAQALAARLPALLVEAERVASTVMQGSHGRRRSGVGDSFWQYRPFLPGDPINRIDWRRSARSDRVSIRETEWEAAQTVVLWVDSSSRLDWRSKDAPVTKRMRAQLLALACGIMLLRAGERVRLAGGEHRNFHGRSAIERLAQAILAYDFSLDAAAVPRNARLLLLSDFMFELPEITSMLAPLSGLAPRPVLMQILDPAEAQLPYSGRIELLDASGEHRELLRNARTAAATYALRFQAHQEGLRHLATQMGGTLVTGGTAESASPSLLAVWHALASQR
ncbi:DUF58 domain-containing protein [Rhodovarius crocodyli]|uniref:DUF58 domain-containing protein n=1 Tax=Rhodovarius crocodyli TaxID=1979269 RepID=A0A437MNA5_9PROT|nr:DUF58 domain-containing protein [Rhodovarius crocodyli]RVT99135.1 DUF58 domain-containing protein [Rhodovarius crocodyli]